MGGTDSRLSSKAADTLKWNDDSSWRTVVSRNGFDTEPPALLTSTSSRPSSVVVASTMAARWSRSLTSPGSTRARRPRARTASATASRSASVRAVSATSAPTSAMATAVAAPMPCPAPVISATWPSRRNAASVALGSGISRPRSRWRAGRRPRARGVRRSRSAGCRSPGRTPAGPTRRRSGRRPRSTGCRGTCRGRSGRTRPCASSGTPGRRRDGRRPTSSLRRRRGATMVAASSLWFAGARASPMSWNRAATTMSVRAPSRRARVAVCSECS